MSFDSAIDMQDNAMLERLKRGLSAALSYETTTIHPPSENTTCKIR
jgi:hypothetical protein